LTWAQQREQSSRKEIKGEGEQLENNEGTKRKFEKEKKRKGEAEEMSHHPRAVATNPLPGTSTEPNCDTRPVVGGRPVGITQKGVLSANLAAEGRGAALG
jgi:hypothetical protein